MTRSRVRSATPAGPTTPQYVTTRGITVSPDNEHLYWQTTRSGNGASTAIR
jgi:hypothetical protein